MEDFQKGYTVVADWAMDFKSVGSTQIYTVIPRLPLPRAQ